MFISYYLDSIKITYQMKICSWACPLFAAPIFHQEHSAIFPFESPAICASFRLAILIICCATFPVQAFGLKT